MKSICFKCNSHAYCANAEKDMEACNNFNKFPKPELSFSEYMKKKQEEHHG